MKNWNPINWNIKKIFKEIVIGALILFVLSNVLSYLRKPDLKNTVFPETKSKLISGIFFESKSVEGKPVLIHFWSTNCPICELEIPNIQSVSKKYEVLSIAINSGSDEMLQAYMKKHGLDFRVINDTHGIWAKQFKIEVFPTTFIYSSKGELQFTEVGYTTTAGLLARLGLLD